MSAPVRSTAAASVAADYTVQRRNMLESQVRPSDITDRRIIRAMGEIPRELFVPEASRSYAYRDDPIDVTPARGGRPPRSLLTARTLAAMIQMLDIGENDRVLIIGAGTGYGAAIVARLAKVTLALESDGDLVVRAEAALAASRTERVTVVSGDLQAGHSAGSPYDAILIEGAVGSMPASILDQLKDGGRLAAIELDAGVGRAMLWRRSGATFASRAVRDESAIMLPGFEPRRQFVF
jgi:protein-L-isoaspartate(D-aspartate) O-methyltransferase